MIITKLLGLTSTLTKSKKAKIAILLIEIGVLLYAISKNSEEHKEREQQKKLNQ